LLQSGLRSIKSAHFTLRETISGQTVKADGDETVANGKAKDLALTESVPGFGTLKLVIANGRSYLQLPSARRTSGKPWTLLTANSTNPTVKAMYSSLQSSQQASGLDAANVFVQAMDNLKFTGSQSLAATTVGHYTGTVVISKLPASFAPKQTLVQAGLGSIPTQLWVDAQGRTRRLTEQINIAGAKFTTVVTLGNFDAPITISAPPANQVSAK